MITFVITLILKKQNLANVNEESLSVVSMGLIFVFTQLFVFTKSKVVYPSFTLLMSVKLG